MDTSKAQDAKGVVQVAQNLWHLLGLGGQVQAVDRLEVSADRPGLGRFRTQLEIAARLRDAGNDRAAGLIEDILEAGDGANGIDALNWLDANSVAELISDEHPQIIAIVLMYVFPEIGLWLPRVLY